MPDVYRSQQALTLSIVVEVSTGNQAHSVNGCLADIDIFRLPLDVLVLQLRGVTCFCTHNVTVLGCRNAYSFVSIHSSVCGPQRWPAHVASMAQIAPCKHMWEPLGMTEMELHSILAG